MTTERFIDAASILEAEKIPLEERVPAFNTYEMIKLNAEKQKDEPAISFMISGDQYAHPTIISYTELFANITRTANFFNSLGIGSTDVIAFLLPNLPQTHYVIWGGEAAGIVCGINPLLEPETIRELLKAANAKVLVALADLPGTEIWKKVEKIRDSLPDLKTIISVMGPGDEANGIYSFEENIPKFPSEKLDSTRQFHPDDVASILHTGGTTGTPKLAPRTHKNETVNAMQMALVTGMREGDAVISGLPLFHGNGMIFTGITPFSVGAHIVMCSPSGFRDVSVLQNFYNIVNYDKASAFSGIPTILSALLNVPKSDVDVSSLRYVLSASAPLSVELFKRFEEYTGLKILEGYGLTEVTCGCSGNPLHGVRKVGSIGFRLPYTEMKIFILDDDGKFIREAKTDEIGNICVKGPNVFKGYLEKSQNVQIFPKEDWLDTGDLGRQDKDEYFWVTGRKKELIIRGGHNIDPAIIEDVLYNLPDISVAAAIGRPDPRVGEVPMAYVELRPDAKLTKDDIMKHLEKNMGERAAIPKEIVMMEQLPLTAVGKIFKPALRWDAIQRVYTKELNVLSDIVETMDIKVGEHKIHGTMATIKVKAGKGVSETVIGDKIKEILISHLIKWEIDFV